MANLYRQNTINITSGSYTAPGASYKVNVYPAGCVAHATEDASVPSAVTLTVYAGHGFAINDYVMLSSNVAKIAKVTASASTSITYDAPLGAVDTNVLLNLGTDTGPSHPSYIQTGSGRVVIYQTPDTSAPITSPAPAEVICDANGSYAYYYPAGTVIWEVIRNSAGTLVGYIVFNSTVLLSSNSVSTTDHSIVRWNGTDGTSIEGDYTAGVTIPVITDGGNITALGTHSFGPTTAAGLTSTAGATVTGGATSVTSLTTSSTAAIGGNTSVAGTLTQTGGGATTLSGSITANQTGTMATFRDTVTRRLYGSGGSTLATTDFAFSGGNWGTSAAITSVAGQDTRFTVKITAGSASTAANAKFILTFKDLGFTTAPFAIITMDNDTTVDANAGTPSFTSWASNTTTLTVNMVSAPTVNKTYYFTIMLIG